jgi:hypothetical protein
MVELAQLLCEEAETELHLILKCKEKDRWREQICKRGKKGVQKIGDANNAKTLELGNAGTFV